MGIIPTNLAAKICYKEDQLRCKSLFGHYLRWRFCKQILAHSSSDNRQVRVETHLFSVACSPSTALADVESNQKILSENFVDHVQEGKQRWELEESIMNHM